MNATLLTKFCRFCSTDADRAKFIASAWKFHLKDSNTGSSGFDFEEALQLLYENGLVGHRDICDWVCQLFHYSKYEICVDLHINRRKRTNQMNFALHLSRFLGITRMLLQLFAL